MRKSGISIIILVQRENDDANKINGRMLSTVVSVQQQLMTQRLLNSHKQKAGVWCGDGLQVWPNSIVPLGVTAQRTSCQDSSSGSVHDSVQSLCLSLYKDTDG